MEKAEKVSRVPGEASAEETIKLKVKPGKLEGVVSDSNEKVWEAQEKKREELDISNDADMLNKMLEAAELEVESVTSNTPAQPLPLLEEPLDDDQIKKKAQDFYSRETLNPLEYYEQKRRQSRVRSKLDILEHPEESTDWKPEAEQPHTFHRSEGCSRHLGQTGHVSQGIQNVPVQTEPVMAAQAASVPTTMGAMTMPMTMMPMVMVPVMIPMMVMMPVNYQAIMPAMSSMAQIQLPQTNHACSHCQVQAQVQPQVQAQVQAQFQVQPHFQAQSEKKSAAPALKASEFPVMNAAANYPQTVSAEEFEESLAKRRDDEGQSQANREARAANSALNDYDEDDPARLLVLQWADAAINKDLKHPQYVMSSNRWDAKLVKVDPVPSDDTAEVKKNNDIVYSRTVPEGEVTPEITADKLQRYCQAVDISNKTAGARIAQALSLNPQDAPVFKPVLEQVAEMKARQEKVDAANAKALAAHPPPAPIVVPPVEGKVLPRTSKISHVPGAERDVRQARLVIQKVMAVIPKHEPLRVAMRTLIASGMFSDELNVLEACLLETPETTIANILRVARQSFRKPN